MVFMGEGLPNSLVAELELTHQVRILSMDPEKMKKVTKKYAYMQSYTLPGGTYKTEPNDVILMSIQSGYHAHSECSH